MKKSLYELLGMRSKNSILKVFSLLIVTQAKAIELLKLNIRRYFLYERMGTYLRKEDQP